MSMSVFVVDDSLLSSKLTAYILEEAGYKTTCFSDGTVMLKQVAQEEPDLILLDVNLPDVDGFEICRRVRRISNTPIIFLSAQNTVNDKVLGLQIGADDYVAKPFDPNELLARIEAVLRRSNTDLLTPLNRLSIYGFTLDPVNHMVKRADGKELELTPIEFRLLYYLMQNAGRILSPEQILTKVWGFDFDGNNNLAAVYIRRLRAKIELNPNRPQWILTVRHIGYKFTQEDQLSAAEPVEDTEPAPIWEAQGAERVAGQ